MRSFFEHPGVFSAWGLDNGQWGDGTTLVEKAATAGFKWIAQQAPQDHDLTQMRAKCHELGVYFGIWEVEPRSLDALQQLRPNFWVLNVEKPDPVYASLLAEFRIHHPLLPAGVITNCDLDPAPFIRANVKAIPEAYLPDNPQATPGAMVQRCRQMGWRKVFPALGVFHGFPLQAYAGQLYGDGFSVYLAEEMTDWDWLNVPHVLPPV